MIEGLTVDTGTREIRVTERTLRGKKVNLHIKTAANSNGLWEQIGADLSKEEAKIIGEKLLEFTNQEEQLHYIKLLNSAYGFLNIETTAIGKEYHVTTMETTRTHKTQFTQTEINSDPELKKFEAFAIPVEQEDAA